MVTGDLSPVGVEVKESDVAALAFLAAYKGDTRKLYAGVLRSFFSWCRAWGIEPLLMTRVQLEVWTRSLEEDGKAPATVHHYQAVVKGFYRIAVADGRITSNPMSAVRRPKVYYDEARQIGLDRIDLTKLVYTSRSSTPEDDAMIALMVVMGFRTSEVCSVDIEDFQGTIRGHNVLMLIGKGGKPATAPLPPPVITSLVRCAGTRTSGPLITRRDGERLDRRTAYRWVKRLAKKAGIASPVHPHTLRHSAITAALDSGASLRDVQVFARHSDPSTTIRYDRNRTNLDRHASYLVAGFIAGS